MKRDAGILLLAGALLAAGSAFAGPKYVMLFIGDGMSTPQRMMAEDFSRLTGRGPLKMNGFPYSGNSRTASANAVVTDSAAVATAIACGEKTDNCMVGQAPDGRRLESVAEFARRRGMRVGVATTVTVCHATPAGFYAHRPNRGLSYQIGLDLVASGFDFFAAGGMGGKDDDRKDPQYRGPVSDLAAGAGYRLVADKAEFAALRPGSGRIWARFTEGSMPYSIDRDGRYPTLAEITAKGIELLDNPGDFFLMVEGGRVDWAGHANDAAASLCDILALDDAVRVACGFAEAHRSETLIVVTGDHETGGLSMGFAGASPDLGVFTNQTCCSDTYSGEFVNRLKRNLRHGFADEIPFAERAFGLRFAGDPKNRMTVTPRRAPGT